MKTQITQLKQQLLQTITREPIAGSLPLYIDGVLAGTLHPNALSVTQDYPHFHYEKDGVNIILSSLNFTQRSTYFNDLAKFLREQGSLPFWRNEQVNVWKNGEIIAHMERTATRPLGLLTQAIHLNAWTPDGRVYLSLRAATKQTDPNKWDTIAGGLLNAEDSQDTGLERETYEEAGIPATALGKRSPIRSLCFIKRPLPEGYQFEEVLTSDCIIPASVQPQNMDGEVSEIRTFSIAEVLDLMQQGMVTAEASVVLLDSFEQDIFAQLQA